MAEPLPVGVSHSTFGGFTEPGGVPFGVITAGINGWLHTRWQHPGPGNSTARDMAVQSVGFWPRKRGGARRRWQEKVAGEGGRKKWQEEVAGWLVEPWAQQQPELAGLRRRRGCKCRSLQLLVLRVQQGSLLLRY